MISELRTRFLAVWRFETGHSVKERYEYNIFREQRDKYPDICIYLDVCYEFSFNAKNERNWIN